MAHCKIKWNRCDSSALGLIIVLLNREEIEPNVQVLWCNLLTLTQEHQRLDNTSMLSVALIVRVADGGVLVGPVYTQIKTKRN